MRLALNVLRSDPEKIPLSHKQLKARWANDDLLKLQEHPNDWYVRHARRILQERAAAAGSGVASGVNSES